MDLDANDHGVWMPNCQIMICMSVKCRLDQHLLHGKVRFELMAALSPADIAVKHPGLHRFPPVRSAPPAQSRCWPHHLTSVYRVL